MEEKRIYLIGTIIMIPVLCMILSVLFPEVKSEAAAVTVSIEPKTAENGILSMEIAENPQNGTINGRIGAPSGYPDELSAMPCCNVSNAFKALEVLEEDDENNRTCESGTAAAPGEGREEETEAEEEITFYTVNGEMLDPDLQKYLYKKLRERECEWFFRYALCQIYQESRFNAAAENPNGLDKGLCQFRVPYFPEVAEASGLVEYDVFNPIDSIYVYTYLMCKYLVETEGDVAMSLSLYRNGYGGAYSAEYVHEVTQWFETIKEVE